MPPSNDKNGELASVISGPVLEELQTRLKQLHVSLELTMHPLCCNTGKNNWKCKRKRVLPYRYCMKCRNSSYESGKRRWNHHAIYDSKRSDVRRGFDIDDDDFITPDWILEQREKQGNRCYYCDRVMQIRRRTAFDGLQPERLTESLPHLKSICVLACGDCNRRSHNWRFCPYPKAQAEALGYELTNYHMFKGTPPTPLPSRLSVYQEHQRRLASQPPLLE